MTDPQSEVRFAALGREWTLKFGTRAMREVEAETGRSILFLDRDMNDPIHGGYKLISAVLAACLRQHHPDVTMDEVDRIFDEIDDMGRLGELVGRALDRGKTQGKGGKDGSARPPKAAASTGRR